MTTLSIPATASIMDRIASETIPTEQVERMTGNAPGDRHLSFLGMVLHLMGISPDDADVVLGVNLASVQRWCGVGEDWRPLPKDMLAILDPLRRGMTTRGVDEYGRSYSHMHTAIDALSSMSGGANYAALDRAVDQVDDEFLPFYNMDEIDALRTSATEKGMNGVVHEDLFALEENLAEINWLAPATPFACLVRIAGMTRRDVADAISERNDTQCSVGDVRSMIRGKTCPCESDMRAMLAIAYEQFRMAHLVMSADDASDAQETALGWFLGLRTPEQCGRWVS